MVDLDLRDRLIRSSRSLKTLQGRDLKEADLLLLPYHVCGYSMQHRMWFPLHCENLESVEADPFALDNVVLPENQKDLLTGLLEAVPDVVSTSSVETNQRTDQGTIVLLLGPPGAGKTTVIEALAAQFGKPFFKVKIPDLGITSNELAQNMSWILRFSEKWHCILLVREADAVLIRVSRSDREGSHMSFMFVGLLEQWKGTLIMTTSRISTFDESVLSRIHMSLFIPPCDDKGSLQLWAHNFDRLLKSNPALEMDYATEQYVQYAKEIRTLQWNGRQIRNCLDTALALAQREARLVPGRKAKLTEQHIRAVVDAKRDFHHYLSDVNGDATNDLTARGRECVHYNSE
ncbi:hypothetical protein NX059_010399 [Plenodomus lindquistii]|nr:hypothetical protein NX059_010399 [Plenodomus lindquistii]